MWKFFYYILFIGQLFLVALSNGNVFHAPVGELFSKKIEPQMFNWTLKSNTEQFKYRPSLEGYPDLPSWLRYMYSNEYQAGFLYGTPSENLAGKLVHLDIVALNKQNFETRKIVLTLKITQKFPAPNVVQMKIDNLNWVHLMDPGRVENLRNIFRKDLWKESLNDLSLVFMESALNMGGRLPLRPNQREGVIVHLGSTSPFSERLKELQEEVRPLYKLSTCTYKRTSVQKIFETAGFKLDWCGFRIVGNEISPEILYHNHVKSPYGSELSTLKRTDKWNGTRKDETPQRNYIDELAFAFAIPTMIFSVLFGILSAVLCFHHQKLFDPASEIYFQNIFHIFEDYYFRDKYQPTTTVQMVQCSAETNNQPTTTLKSLKDPMLDNVSLHSQSPNNSLYRNAESPRNGNNYLRPNPPPYKASSIDRSTGNI